jgi:midasin (ATPase involved in ribosome maturation)
LNVLRVFRALQIFNHPFWFFFLQLIYLNRILLEGDPGVGKTSLISSLALSSGHKLTRINLSERFLHHYICMWY